MKTLTTSNKFVIYLVFIFSGIAGLIYESIWAQYLSLFLGHAAIAQTLTLAIFMGGVWLLDHHLFNYSSFDIPVFELLGTQDKIIAQLNHTAYDYHPFIPTLKTYNDAINVILQNSSLHNLSIEKLGIVNQFNHPNEYCGLSEKLESRWMSSYVSIYDITALLGFKKLNKLLETEYIDICKSKLSNQKYSSIIDALQYFSNEDFNEFILIVNEIISNDMQISNKIKLSLINKSLYSHIELIKNLNYSNSKIINKLLRENAPILNDTSKWLISFL